MPIFLQLHFVMMSKYSKFGVDTFNTFCVIGYIKVLHDADDDNGNNNDDNLAITIALFFIRNKRAKDHSSLSNS